MDTNKIIQELEFLYHQFLRNNNMEKAQETLLKIAELKERNEGASPNSDQNILLG